MTAVASTDILTKIVHLLIIAFRAEASNSMNKKSKSRQRKDDGSAPQKIPCGVCGKLIPRRLRQAHIKYGHQVQDGVSPKEESPAETTKEPVKKAKEPKVRRVSANVISERQIQASKLTKPTGIRIDRKETCSFCKKAKIPVWLYSIPKGDSGYICESCRSLDPVEKRKKPKHIDALDRAVSGGGFETNRRRH